ncbi:MAG: signal peptidase II [Alteromonadaceae bacterium]|nr:MAG: signal peptidase II [Alteromonadaceae bacterium]
MHRYLPWCWYLFALIVVILDLFSKKWASSNFALYDREMVFSMFDLTLRHNYGAAFNFLAQEGGWQRAFLASVSSAVSIGLIVWIARLDQSKRLEALGMALILGGALGNLYDRATLGYVVDFILLHYKEMEFPVFNIADLAITLGVVILFWDALFDMKSEA